MTFANINGAVVHFRDEGSRNGQPLVFINSLGTDFRIWDELVPDFVTQSRVVRYDKRGHGLSGLPSNAASLEDFASDLAGLLEFLGLSQAAIVGLSIGGLIAQELYRQRPDLVRALILCDTAAKIGSEDMWAIRMTAIEAGGVASVADGVLERWFSAGYRTSRQQDFAGWRLMLARTDKAGYLAACGALRAADLRPFCREIRVPTLCVVGEEDSSTPVALVRELAESITHARFEIVANAGHLPNLEQPRTISSLIGTFLQSLPQ